MSASGSGSAITRVSTSHARSADATTASKDESATRPCTQIGWRIEHARTSGPFAGFAGQAYTSAPGGA